MELHRIGNQMRVYIEGYDSGNWGDVLMATASAALARRVRPGAEIIFPRPLPLKESDLQAALGTPGHIVAGNKPSFWGRFQKPRGAYNISHGASAAAAGDCVLFCNGYLMGDPWRAAWISRVANAVKRLNRRGVKVVLMPQSFGPFTDPVKAALVKTAVTNAALVFSRDEMSFRYLRDLGCTDPKFSSSVDYTGLLNRHPCFPVVTARENRLIIIPNVKIRQTMGKELEADYLRRLETISRVAQEKYGLSVKVVLHTAHKDLGLAQQVADLAAINEVVSGDPFEIRRFIGQSRFVVASRFHGLMNALSQGIPALSLGWSHKYDELMRHYGVAEYALNLRSDATVLDAFERLVSEEDALRAALPDAHSKLEAAYYHQLEQQLATLLGGVTASVRVH
jgi:colanic acid/amylovoran biosynthesis protein